MAERPSLLSDSQFDSIGRKGSRQSSASNSDKIKLGLAAAALLIAGVLLAWNFGLIGGGEPEGVKSSLVTPERSKEIEQEQKRLEKLAEEGEIELGGA